MKNKKSIIFWIAILLIVVIVIGFKTYYDQKHNWKYYDPIPANPEGVLIAQSDSIIPVSHTKQTNQDRFYVTIENNHIDDGIFYEPKNKNIDKGFLIEMKEDGTFGQVF